MSKKTEIKVYLPVKMVGELEAKKRAGIRSEFIRNAIRRSLDKEEEFDLWDIDTEAIVNEAIVRLRSKISSGDLTYTIQFIRRLFQ